VEIYHKAHIILQLRTCPFLFWLFIRIGITSPKPVDRTAHNGRVVVEEICVWELRFRVVRNTSK